jgi:hypothetical protein
MLYQINLLGSVWVSIVPRGRHGVEWETAGNGATLYSDKQGRLGACRRNRIDCDVAYYWRANAAALRSDPDVA